MAKIQAMFHKGQESNIVGWKPLQELNEEILVDFMGPIKNEKGI